MRLVDLFILFSCLSVSGCYKGGTRMPVYELPPRPVLDTLYPDTANEQALRHYGASLETILRKHNEFAVQHNKKVVE